MNNDGVESYVTYFSVVYSSIFNPDICAFICFTVFCITALSSDFDGSPSAIPKVGNIKKKYLINLNKLIIF